MTLSKLNQFTQKGLFLFLICAIFTNKSIAQPSLKFWVNKNTVELKKGSKIKTDDLGSYEQGIQFASKEQKLKNRIVVQNGMYGLMDSKRILLTDLKYDNITDFDKEYYLVNSKRLFGILNEQGQEVVPVLYNFIMNIDEKNRYVVKQNQRYGIIDIKNNPIIPIVYDYISPSFKPNTFLLHRDGKYGLVDINNALVVPFIYDKFEYLSMNQVIVSKDFLWGCLNENLEYSIPLIYENRFEFENNSAIVKLKKRYGLINQLGEIIVPIIYDYGLSKLFYFDYYEFCLEGKVFRFDSLGNKIEIPLENESNIIQDRNPDYRDDLFEPKWEFNNKPSILDMYTDGMTNASFPGGDSALQNYITKNIKYPQEDLEAGRKEYKSVSFRVTDKGEIKNVTISNSEEVLLDYEAIRLVENMPSWIPAKLDGKNIDSYPCYVTVTFKLKK